MVHLAPHALVRGRLGLLPAEDHADGHALEALHRVDDLQLHVQLQLQVQVQVQVEMGWWGWFRVVMFQATKAREGKRVREGMV
jgi:hypothetical protein